MRKLVIAAALAGSLAAAMSIGVQAKTLTFLEVNDLHANLVPHKDLLPSGKIATRGGLTRIATVVKRTRAENPHTLLMMVGDTFHGGVEAFYSMGNAIVGPVNALGVDVGVAGNWDYYYTPIVTRARFGPFSTEFINVRLPGMDEPIPIRRPNYPNLGANVEQFTDRFMPRDFMPDTWTKTVNGTQVGFIGLTSDMVEHMHPILAEGLDFAKGEAEHRDIVNRHTTALRNAGAEVVVVMSELGLHKTRRLADVISTGVDVFFVGHTHELTWQPYVSRSGARVVEAGNDGWVGRMDVTLQTDSSGRDRITAFKWQLVGLGDNVPEDPDMKRLVDAERAKYLAPQVDLVAPPFLAQHLHEPIDTVIGHTDSMISRKDVLESSFNNDLTQLMRELTGTQAALSPGFRMDTTVATPGYLYEDGSIATGVITLEDAYRLFPMHYGIATAQVQGARLKQILEGQYISVFSSNPFNHFGGWGYGISGLRMNVDIKGGDNNRIKSMAYEDGRPVGAADTITITGCRRLPIDYDGRLCGLPGFENVTDVIDPNTSRALTALDAFVSMVKQRRFNGANKRLIEISGIARFPSGGNMVQPLNTGGAAVTPTEDECGYFKWTCDSAPASISKAGQRAKAQ